PQFADAETRGQPVSFDQRRVADLETDRWFAGHRQELTIAPHRLRTRLDRLARHPPLDAIEIVGNFERTEAEFTNMCRGQRIFPPAFAALEGLHETVLFHNHIPIGATKN